MIRRATAADLPAIDRVFRQSFCDTFGHLYAQADLDDFLSGFTAEAWQREFNDPEYRFVVAEEAGHIAGYAKLGPSALPVKVNGRAVELRQLYVLRAHHGTGIAAELMEWVLDHARSGGFDELYLTVFTGNERARRFYRRYGCEELGPYAFMVGSHADEDVIMVKRL